MFDESGVALQHLILPRTVDDYEPVHINLVTTWMVLCFSESRRQMVSDEILRVTHPPTSDRSGIALALFRPIQLDIFSIDGIPPTMAFPPSTIQFGSLIGQ
jgi:hypothetical protein